MGESAEATMIWLWAGLRLPLRLAEWRALRAAGFSWREMRRLALARWLARARRLAR